jgi:hypothetical protein
MQIVPKGKTVYIGARKFVEGDVIPPAIKLEIPEMTKKEAAAKAKKESKSKSSFRSRSGAVISPTVSTGATEE